MHDSSTAARLLVVAHGTASPAGRATTAELVDALRVVRPHVTVDLCFLDVASPTLPDALTDVPTVLVPLLLSTGYHVRSDIPAAVTGWPHTVVARHLGPHALLIDAVLDRLAGSPGDTTVLVGAGSSRDEARTELDTTADLLAERLGTPVTVLTMADDLAAELRRLPAPARVATYLLAEGRFTETLERAAAGVALVAPPIGVHPAVVELVWSRFDDAAATRASGLIR